MVSVLGGGGADPDLRACRVWHELSLLSWRKPSFGQLAELGVSASLANLQPL